MLVLWRWGDGPEGARIKPMPEADFLVITCHGTVRSGRFLLPDGLLVKLPPDCWRDRKSVV